MQTAIICPARRPCNQKRNHKCGNPNRRGDQQGLDIPISERLDDGREEILEVL